MNVCHTSYSGRNASAPSAVDRYVLNILKPRDAIGAGNINRQYFPSLQRPDVEAGRRWFVCMLAPSIRPWERIIGQISGGFWEH